MSQPNSEVQGMVFVMAVFGAAAMVFGIIVASALVLLTFILTVLAMIAWFRPLQIGELIIEPPNARSFVYRGLIGLIALPTFCVFTSVLFQFWINPDIFPYVYLAGYVAGSLGVELLLLEQQSNSPSEPLVDEVAHEVNKPASLPEPEPEPAPFRYASWDDEEETK